MPHDSNGNWLLRSPSQTRQALPICFSFMTHLILLALRLGAMSAGKTRRTKKPMTATMTTTSIMVSATVVFLKSAVSWNYQLVCGNLHFDRFKHGGGECRSRKPDCILNPGFRVVPASAATFAALQTAARAEISARPANRIQSCSCAVFL